MIQEKNITTTVEDDSIDIIALLKEFWNARKTILKITTLFFFLGLFVAIFSKNEFTASTTFVPLAQGSASGGSLGSLASLAGINIGGGVNSEEISPELYPQIVSSIPFQLELLKTPLSIEGQDQKVSYRDYYEKFYNAGLLATIKKYTLGLPGVIISLVKSNAEVIENDKGTQENKIIRISQEETGLIKLLEAQVLLSVNAKEGFVSIAVTLPEAVASAQLTAKAQQLLQAYALQFKTQKSRAQLDYIKD
jgi:LPS O-antigen subunit length determinant protein (WzzB/FepE family)